jgi:CRISPR system Cascade subunit CasA
MTQTERNADSQPVAPRYNLVDEPWIPVQRLDGTRDELGIRDTLLHADQIAEIQDGSPLVVAALHRLLLAVLYRALEGPTDGRQAAAWFRDGWPLDRIDAYLQRWRERFWLFHATHPFAQIPSFEPKAWRAWTVLAAEHNADNAKVLFDHIAIDQAGSVEPARAARWLIAAQAFSVSAGKSELAHTSTAPSATSALVMPIGATLRDTLAYLLVPQNRLVLERDLPLWERDPESLQTLMTTNERRVEGYADRYTWRTRAVRLKADPSGRVGGVAFASGMSAADDRQEDPMAAYRNDDKRGRLPLIFRERGLWRDFDSLLPGQAGDAPRVIDHAIAMGRDSSQRFPQAVLVAGQANDKAKIEFWRIERFHLPQALRSSRLVRNEVRELLAKAEEVQSALWVACSALARDLLSHGTRSPEKRDISGAVAQMPAIAMYWSILEASFHAVLHDYTERRDWEDIRWSWIKAVRDSLSRSWNCMVGSVGPSDAWSVRAVARAEQPVRRRLALLSREIDTLDPAKEPA